MSKVNLSRFSMAALLMGSLYEPYLYGMRDRKRVEQENADAAKRKEYSLSRMQKLCKDTRVLRKYTIKGVTVFAYSKKDALIRLKHRKG